MSARTPLMLIARIRCILCVACKCVSHYWGSENLQLHRNNMLRFSQSQAFVQIESSTSERVWSECDKETLGCFTAIFRSTPIWRITAVDVWGDILLETYCCALNLASALQCAKGQMYCRLRAWSCPAGMVQNSMLKRVFGPTSQAPVLLSAEHIVLESESFEWGPIPKLSHPAFPEDALAGTDATRSEIVERELRQHTLREKKIHTHTHNFRQ